ncbi:PAS modulated Fis family sigma54 specific transcriptional regulator [Desulfitobacterium sp. LBE]|uniref:Putative arginine utilization regulatory protein RocR n=1 Tax=Desulfitobacterium hafniense DP7 TaxID=537010 RepID=G9XIU1_DESHA|nr:MULTISPECIES: sigma-54-dependent Fis family transcriptional regulator [Desulfitobacterium]EHL08369.1 putative arginine utilization regulatory protein RocR [Desulfitobacterium hafniense DP7]TWH57383.1 PAS modulated Fis family sigma54 specific transcriptional regulator [Desulfitobacterium sp. LBE]
MKTRLKEIIAQYPFFFDILNTIDASVYFCDINGRLLYVNKAAERLDGYTNEELYGRTVTEIYGLDEETSPMLRALTSEKPLEDISFRYDVNGREIYQICNARPIFLDGKKFGAYTIQKDVTHLMEVIERNIRFQKEMFSPTGDSEGFGIDSLIGEHPLFKECKKMAIRAAKSDSPVLLTGATGSGKELFARCIHQNSDRNKGPFLAINCAAIPETLLESILFGTSKGIYTGALERKGLFEQAEGGTLFLDEINSMPLVSQSKLLRVLEEKEIAHLGSNERIKVDVRIISSSNTPPQEAISSKQIREDIFYRLAVVNIMIPSLAERKSDIFLLANHFISVFNERFRKHILALDDEVLGFFLKFPWPGNVRQLKHCIESAMNFVTDEDLRISKDHLPVYLFSIDNAANHGAQGSSPPKEPVDRNRESKPPEPESTGVFSAIVQKEKEQIIKALMENQGNVSKTAKQLGMHRQSLIYRIKKYKIT